MRVSGACVPRETVDQRGEWGKQDERSRHRHEEVGTIAEDECACNRSGDADNRADDKQGQPADLAARSGRANGEVAGDGGENKGREGQQQREGDVDIAFRASALSCKGDQAIERRDERKGEDGEDANGAHRRNLHG